MSGVPMPNFLNVGHSLRRELNENNEDEDYRHLQIDSIPFILKTPELIIEEEEDSDLESSTELNEEEGKNKQYFPFEKVRFLTFYFIVVNRQYWSNEENIRKIIKCQGIVRTWLAKKEAERKQKLYESPEFNTWITGLQLRIKSVCAQKKLIIRYETLTSLDSKFTVHLQAQCRGYMRRVEYRQRLDYYRAHIDQIVKVQNFIKNKLMGNAYRRLTTDLYPSLDTVKSFIHLLDDSDLDFDRELELESLLQEVIEYIRENNMLESHVTALDIQIALFLKNAITIEEVLKHTGSFKKKKKRETERMMMNASANNQTSPFSLSGVDKESRQRLELFQQLVYVLQTEPEYVARLLSLTNRQDLGQHSSHKLIESTVLSLFGYATNAREEYLLINLCKVSLSKDLGETRI